LVIKVCFFAARRITGAQPPKSNATRKKGKLDVGGGRRNGSEGKTLPKSLKNNKKRRATTAATEQGPQKIDERGGSRGTGGRRRQNDEA